MEGRQVEEAMLAVLHTVLLHRSTGKFHYKKEGTYSIGTVGTQDVDCDFIDFTYVRVSSEELDRALRKVVGEFKVGRGTVSGKWTSNAPLPQLAVDYLTFPGCICGFFQGLRNRHLHSPSWGVEGLCVGHGGGGEGARKTTKEEGEQEALTELAVRSPRLIIAPVVLTFSLTPQLSLLAPSLCFHCLPFPYEAV